MIWFGSLKCVTIAPSSWLEWLSGAVKSAKSEQSQYAGNTCAVMSASQRNCDVFLGDEPLTQSDQNNRKITRFFRNSENSFICCSKQLSFKWQIIWVVNLNTFPQSCGEKVVFSKGFIWKYFTYIFLIPIPCMQFLLCDHKTIKHLFANCLNNYATTKHESGNILELI